MRNEQMMRVNMMALTSLTRHFLPQMIARKRGGILNVSSSAGFLPIPTFAIYAATKAYVTSFSEALRAELRGTGVSVCALCPGPVHTEFQEVAKRPGGQREEGPEFVHVSVGQVVRDALSGLEADRPLVIPGLPMKVGMFLVRITPMPILRWASRFRQSVVDAGPRRSKPANHANNADERESIGTEGNQENKKEDDSSIRTPFRQMPGPEQLIQRKHSIDRRLHRVRCHRVSNRCVCEDGCVVIWPKVIRGEEIIRVAIAAAQFEGHKSQQIDRARKECCVGGL